jgi:hypothetical protein
MLVAPACAVAASGTHALHLPELFGAMHASELAQHDDVMATPMVATPAAAAADAAVHEMWCAVVALPPVTIKALVLQTAAALLFSLALGAQAAWSPGSRTKPPPLLGTRLRATLQVFRN